MIRENLENELKGAIEDFCSDVNHMDFLRTHYGIDKEFITEDEIMDYIDFDEIIENHVDCYNENPEDTDVEVFNCQNYLNRDNEVTELAIECTVCNEVILSCDSYVEYLKSTGEYEMLPEETLELIEEEEEKEEE